MNIIFPLYPFTKTIDADYLDEYNYVKNNTNFNIIMIDFENKKIFNKNNDISIYRGWMLSEDEYSWLNSSLNLMINTEIYLNMQYLPNWYKYIKDLTFKSLIYDSLDEFTTSTFVINKKYLIKNFVKSIYDKNGPVVSENKDEIIQSIQSDKYNNFPGIVLREFEELQNETEKRVFVFKKCILNKSDSIPLIEKVVDLLPYGILYSIDYVLTKNNEFKIVEIGDGQTSSLKNCSIFDFYKNL